MHEKETVLYIFDLLKCIFKYIFWIPLGVYIIHFV